MSVRKGDRGEGNLQVLNLARNLAKHTIDKCRSEKIFPKNQRWTICKPIMDECLGALTCIRRANAVYVGDESALWRYRRMQQVQAHSHIDALLTLLDIAYISFNFGSRASRKPSAIRLKESIKSAMTIIGGTI